MEDMLPLGAVGGKVEMVWDGRFQLTCGYPSRVLHDLATSEPPTCLWLAGTHDHGFEPPFRSTIKSLSTSGDSIPSDGRLGRPSLNTHSTHTRGLVILGSCRGEKAVYVSVDRDAD